MPHRDPETLQLSGRKRSSIGMISAIFGFITLIFLQKVAILVVSIIIVREEPKFYRDGWMTKAATITSLVLSSITILGVVLIVLLFPLLKNEETAGSGVGGTSLEFTAEVFALVLTYISWDVMWKHELGKAFCILVGIVTPAVLVLLIVFSCVVCCISLGD